MTRLRKFAYVAFLVLLGAFLVLQAFGAVLGWGGRAPDVVYGDELNFPEELVLLFVAILLYRRNGHAKLFAAVLALLNGIAAGFHVDGLSRTVAFSWVVTWTVVFAASSWPSLKRFNFDARRKQLKIA